MAETARMPKHNAALMREQIELLRKSLGLTQTNVNKEIAEPAPVAEVEPIDPFNAKVIDFPVEEVKPVEQVEEKKPAKVQKTESEKSRLVTSPTLLLNNIRIALLDRKIAHERKLNEIDEAEPIKKESKKGIVSKVTSAGSFLVSLPKTICSKLSFGKIGATLQAKYGEAYYNHLEKVREKERLRNIELADKLEEENRQERQNQSIQNVLAALKENDRQIIEAKKAELDNLRYEPIEEEVLEEENHGGILRR